MKSLPKVSVCIVGNTEQKLFLIGHSSRFFNHIMAASEHFMINNDSNLFAANNCIVLS